MRVGLSYPKPPVVILPLPIITEATGTARSTPQRFRIPFGPTPRQLSRRRVLIWEMRRMMLTLGSLFLSVQRRKVYVLNDRRPDSATICAGGGATAYMSASRPILMCALPIPVPWEHFRFRLAFRQLVDRREVLHTVAQFNGRPFANPLI